jgi:hypothetical protein
MPQITPYRFGLNLIVRVGFRSDGRERRGGDLTADGLGFRRIGSGLSDSDDVVLPGACGGDDGAQQRSAISMGVVARWRG